MKSKPESCPNCGKPFEYFLRYKVQSNWRWFFYLPDYAVICADCKEIVGWERKP